MGASPLRLAAGCALTLAAVCGCGTTITSKVPNWPQSSDKSAEETRAIREAEVARYRTTQEQMTTKMLMSNITGDKSKMTPAPEGTPARSGAVPTSKQAPVSPAPSTKEVKLGNWEAQPPEKPVVVASTAPARTANKPASTEATQSSRYGDLVFISGQLPVDARGQPIAADTRIEDQIRLALDNVRWALEAQRLSMANVVSMTVFLRDLNHARIFDEVFANYTKGMDPARSVVEVSRLPNNANIEISAVAGR
jgi:2-iminobutanoate/2-iminopropanoate deaminase